MKYLFSFLILLMATFASAQYLYTDTTTGDVVLYFNEDGSVTAMSPILDIQYMSFDDINRIDEILRNELERELETPTDENNS